MDGLYDRDFVLWSEAEADKLRRLRAGERVNDVDWENLIEEVESLGKSETRATESYLFRVIEHVLKTMAWPGARDADHWEDEITRFLFDASKAFSPSMRQHLSVEDIYRRALRSLRHKRNDGAPPGPLPQAPWFTLDDLLSEDVDGQGLRSRAPRHGLN